MTLSGPEPTGSDPSGSDPRMVAQDDGADSQASEPADPAHAALPPRARTEPFVFVIPVYNAAGYIERCLESILQQRGSWGAVVIDDNSNDGTWTSILRVAGADSRFTVLRNSARQYQLYNTAKAIRAYCGAPESIIALLDGDDWLLGHDVVEKLIAAHRRYDVVWSNHRIHPTGALGWSFYLPPLTDIRRHPFVTSHLRTFKKHLFDRIRVGDLLDDNGAYLTVAGDQAYMLPILELAGPLRRHFLDEVLCCYNRETLLSEDKVAGERQRHGAEFIRSRPAYACASDIDPRELSRISQAAWTLGGDGVLEVYDAEVVGLRFAASPQKGQSVALLRTVEALPGTRYTLGIEVRDGYSDPNYPARIEQQISIGGLVLWRHDLSGDTFDGWNPVRLDHKASATQVDITVELTAVGAVEPGWGWEHASQTVVRGFSWERLD